MSFFSENKKPELLAPAGSFESVLAAVRCGADAVYAGGERFSARANAANFSDGDLKKAAEYCHLHGVKLYRAMNTLVFADEMKDFLAAARYSAEIGVDGIIVQDIGAARLIREMLPEMRLNASTQMTIHTPEGARLAQEMGFSRVVAARELSAEQIKKLIETGIEIEVFIHGALCMSVSGQCYMSALIGSRSANRGMCAQACRLPFSKLPFSAVGDGERYDLSLKDLCGIPHIKALADMGTASFKIEGRMKRAEYVAAAVTACRAALDGGEPDIDTLRSVFSRSGFTDGYLTGKLGADMFGYRRKEDVTAAEAVLPKLRESFRREVKIPCGNADFHAELLRGKPAKLEMRCGEITVSAEGPVPEEAKKRPADLDYVRRQVEKLGDTVYTLGSVSADIDGGLILSAASLNAMRRENVGKMDKAVISAATPRYECRSADIGTKTERRYPKRIRVRISDAAQLDGIPEDIEVIIPLDEAEKLSAEKRFIIAPPRFLCDEGKISAKLAEMKNAGFTRLLCVNLAYVKIGRELGFELCGGFGLNIVNPYAAETAARLGLADITAGFEAKLPKIGGLCGKIPVGIIVYGRLPVMLTRNCPIKSAVGGCKGCTKKLADRTGREFPVVCNKSGSGFYCEVLNSDILMMTDRRDEISADFAELDFTDETAEEVRRVISLCREGKRVLETGFTRGLYYRGIL